MNFSDIARPEGTPENRDFGMHLNLTLPDAKSDLEATERQAEAILLFYKIDFGGNLRFCQAHALLSCREFARLSAQTIFKQYPPDVQNIIARALAAFLLSDVIMVQFVVNWSSAAFNRGSSSPRVRGSQIFHDVEDFASYIKNAIELKGWTIEHLRKLRFR